MNTSNSASTDSVFVLPLIPLIDYPVSSAESEDEELVTAGAHPATPRASR